MYSLDVINHYLSFKYSLPLDSIDGIITMYRNSEKNLLSCHGIVSAVTVTFIITVKVKL